MCEPASLRAVPGGDEGRSLQPRHHLDAETGALWLRRTHFYGQYYPSPIVENRDSMQEQHQSLLRSTAW